MSIGTLLIDVIHSIKIWYQIVTFANTDPFAPRIWQLAHNKSIELGPSAILMGILNVTPDSFSDGGSYLDLNKAIQHSAKMIRQGADIIDIGGESTKPGATPVSLAQEQDRVLPIIEALKSRFDIILSIDTYRSQTAHMALERGVNIVNDVWGFHFDDKMPSTVASFGAGACLMHNSRERTLNPDLFEDQKEFLSASLNLSIAAGISENQLILDPGFGFGKNADDNLSLLSQFSRLTKLQLPLLTGTSRKRFTGKILGKRDTPTNRDIVTSATSVIARMAGSAVFRVHEVEMNKNALMLADAVLQQKKFQ